MSVIIVSAYPKQWNQSKLYCHVNSRNGDEMTVVEKGLALGAVLGKNITLKFE